MAHNLFGGRFASYRQPAWHKLGVVFEERLTVTEAFKLGGLDFGIRKVPLTYISPASGEVVLSGSHALIREMEGTDEEAVLGVVGEGYSFVDNMALAAKLDPIGQVWPVETVGALGKGERIWALLSIGNAEIAGEDFTEGMMVSDSRDGFTALTISFVTKRVVCENTFNVAMRGASFTQRVGHGANHEEEVDFWVDLVPMMRKVQAATRESFEALVKYKISIDEAGVIFSSAWPEPRQSQKARLKESLGPEWINLPAGAMLDVVAAQASYERQVGRHRELMDSAQYLYGTFSDKHPSIAETAWAAFNVVTEIADHGNGRDKDAARAQSAMFGEHAAAKQRAYDAALALIN